MTRNQKIVGWVIFTGTFLTAMIYVAIHYDTGDPVLEIFVEALLLITAPGYFLYLAYSYFCMKRFPPLRFIAGVALFWLAVLGWAIGQSLLGDNAILELLGLIAVVTSFILMKPELDNLMLGKPENERRK